MLLPARKKIVIKNHYDLIVLLLQLLILISWCVFMIHKLSPKVKIWHLISWNNIIKTKKENKCTNQLLNDLFDYFTEWIIWMFTIQVVNEFCDNFRVGFRLKSMAFRFKIIFHIFVICYDPIVYNNKWVFSIRPLWMWIYFRWYTWIKNNIEINLINSIG